MRLRLEPRARRKATSRERSAARAPNRLPRLAQAANSIKPERSINPVRKARVAPPNSRHEDQAAPAYKAHYLLLWDSLFSDTNPRSSDRQWPAPERLPASDVPPSQTSN